MARENHFVEEDVDEAVTIEDSMTEAELEAEEEIEMPDLLKS